MKHSSRNLAGVLALVGVGITSFSNRAAAQEQPSAAPAPAPVAQPAGDPASPAQPAAQQPAAEAPATQPAAEAPATQPAAAEPVPYPDPQPAEADVQADASVGVETQMMAPLAPAPAPPQEEAAFEKSFNVGVGIRAEYTFNPDDSPPEGTDIDRTHSVGANVRPYISGQVHENVKVTGNLDGNVGGLGAAGGGIGVLDGILQLEFSDFVNIWLGRMLPPNDRANLSGPYYQNSWNYPLQANLYPAVNAGRDDGFAYWGQAGGGVFKWQLGVFGLTAPTTQPRYYARVVANLLDPEPGYYNSSTYYGSQDVLAIGAVLNHDRNYDGANGNGTRFNADVLFEKTFGAAGTLDVEGAYYNFKSTDEGHSFNFNVSYLFPGKVGIGQLQPQFRVLWFNNDEVIGGNAGPLAFPGAAGAGERTTLTTDVGLNYIIDGHNARLSLTWQRVDNEDTPDGDDAIENGENIVIFGGQVQL